MLYPHRPTPDAMFELIQRHRPTLFFGVPTLYAAMLQVKEAEKRYDLSCLRLCVSAGEALPEELYKRWQERFGVEILDGIGTTEILHIFLSNRPGPRPARLDRADGAGVRGDRRGRRGPPGARRGDRQPARQGRLDHGLLLEPAREDEGHAARATGSRPATSTTRTPDGYFWYCGRADDMLKVGGIWVSPVEVENTLMGHPAVLEAAVVGHEDTDELVKPKAFVVLKDGHAASAALEAELKAFVKDKIAPYKYPRWIEFVPELPKTATGKIQRFKLRQ